MAVLGFLPGFSRRRHERAGFALYTAITTAAREPVLFLRYRVPDTLDGRFDTLALYAVLVMIRLSADSPPGPAVAQAVFDAMFSDMDLTLREMGAGDPTVPRKMRAMWDALHGRALAYQKALANPQDAAPSAYSPSMVPPRRGNPITGISGQAAPRAATMRRAGAIT